MSQDNDKKADSGIVYVGKNPPMTYAVATMSVLSKGGEASLRARGRSITTAVDAAEIVTKRLAKGIYATKSIDIGTEVLTKDGITRNVSFIIIDIGKPAA